MIRIVTKISGRTVDGSPVYTELPMIPASGTFRTDMENTEAGCQIRKTLSARLGTEASSLENLLHGELVLKLEFEDGTTEYIGTDDVPVRLRISSEDTIDISAEHISGVR